MNAIGPERELGPEELAGLLDLGGRPPPAVLDTACVRTGLHYQLRNGTPPASVTTARDGMIRLFMEFETLSETLSRLPRFAAQFGVTAAELRRMLAEDWLPHIQVVKLPPSLRKLDPRAAAVRDKDADDYPAAALAALLSPCILLTHNHKDFAALGVHTSKQGVDAVMGVIAVDIGELRLRAVVMVPTGPAQLAIAGGKWAAERIGPKAVWTIVIAAAAAILRELAIAPEPLSAQQLASLLDESLRRRVADLRALLRADDALFREARRGGYELRRHYLLPDAG